MRKTMKLGASTLAAVALVAGSAAAASAFNGPEDPYICGNSVAENEAEGDGANADSTGNGPVPNCQVGYTNIYNNNATSDDNEGGDTGVLGGDLGGILDVVTP